MTRPDPFKRITSIDDAIEVDNQLQYQMVPSDHVTVDTIRNVDSKAALEEFDYPTPLTYEGKTFYLDEKQVRDIYRYKNVLQLQYLETELDRVDVINVFSGRYAPIKLETIKNKIYEIMGEPEQITFGRKDFSLMQFPQLESASFEGVREQDNTEKVDMYPTIMFSYNSGRRSFIFGYTVSIIHCMNALHLLVSASAKYNLLNTKVVHTTDQVADLDVSVIVENWKNNAEKYQEAMLEAMRKRLTVVNEIMLYVACAQSVDMLFELLTRPQIANPASFWDAVMNVTRLNSNFHNNRSTDREFRPKQLQDAAMKAGTYIMDDKEYSIRDYIRGIDNIEALREQITERPNLIKVNLDMFYKLVGLQITEGCPEHIEGEDIQVLPQMEIAEAEEEE
ncbi:hypothetical protein LCGC14_0267060 [marine sediment metagenome]|uniref:Uncharacterized protein n=1 Tax=marine sediment metagenome TaxID=412755 RepID=A0A0F9TZU5_9ZZZZ